MHEVSVAVSLIHMVAADAAARGIQQVDALDVCVGEWSGINPEALRFAFDLLRAGTLCAAACLSLTFVKASNELAIVAYEGR